MNIFDTLDKKELDKVETGFGTIADMHYKYRISDFNKPIIITFPPNRDKINNDPSIDPFNYKFLLRYDVNILCFGVLGSHKDNYFINPDFSHFIEKLGKKLGVFKLRLGYANSKGGFGIGAYAEALKLDHAILFHPVSTKNIELVPWDNKSTTKESQHLDWSGPYGDVNMGKCKAYIIYDPLDKIDVNHAKRFPNSSHIKLYGYGHSQGYYFLAKHSNVIKDLIFDFIHTQTVDVKKLRKNAKLLRTMSFYFEQLLKIKPNNKKLIKEKDRLDKIVEFKIKEEKNNNNKIEFFRNLAIKLEKTDLEASLNLMLMAKELRPNGPIINKKIKEYRERKKQLAKNKRLENQSLEQSNTV